MTIGSIIGAKGREVHTIEAGTSVRAAVAQLAERRVGAMPVIRGGELAGIFSERDLIYCLAREGAGILDAPIDRLMTAPAVTVTPDQSILGALALMTERRIRHLPVVDRGALVGIVSIGDLVKARIDRIEDEARAMRDYITSA